MLVTNEAKINPNANAIKVAKKDTVIDQFFGTVLAREIWQNKKILNSGEFLGFGR